MSFNTFLHTAVLAGVVSVLIIGYGVSRRHSVDPGTLVSLVVIGVVPVSAVLAVAFITGLTTVADPVWNSLPLVVKLFPAVFTGFAVAAVVVVELAGANNRAKRRRAPRDPWATR